MDTWDVHAAINQKYEQWIDDSLSRWGMWSDCTAYKREPDFPEGRKDVAVCHHTYESSGAECGVEMLFVLKEEAGKVDVKCIYHSAPSLNFCTPVHADVNVYIHLEDVRMEEGDLIIVFSSGGEIFTHPDTLEVVHGGSWVREMRVSLADWEGCINVRRGL